MQSVDPSTIIGIMLAALIMQLWRYIQRSKFWANVFKTAASNLSDPNKPEIDTPEKAAESAVLDSHRPEIVKVARTLKESDPPPDGRVPDNGE